VVGAEKAIALVTARPEATELGAFAEDLATTVQEQRTELGTLRASLATAENKAVAAESRTRALEAQVTALGKNPVVITASGDPAGPATGGAALQGEAKHKADFAASAELQAEFGSEAAYCVYMRDVGERE
jgi:hypothetical protein